ncbi:sialate O-acetylesterase [Capnocytophaga canis]|uniref:SGNH/GDSL hydrolase family protein n=1 Tax=Capnocytophaga TaxID=1016 RepID=UPI000BB1866E|nr:MULTISPECIES: SGNH/GDSL hydrolase family protein [Capnocytophaga]ATA75353.1 sialate O-acetylesterase [Capnocytophaga sp. H2931]GIM61515.1 sialate O-acetylesterase [Capnocytophaga canis]
MKRFVVLSFFVVFILNGYTQERKYSHFYEQRSDLFEKLPVTSEDIVFIGNSITNGGEWSELFPEKKVKNRGISADTTEGVYERLDYIVKAKPAKIFLMIGVNDIARGFEVKTIVDNMKKIVQKIQQESPTTKIHIQSLLPVNPDFGTFKNHMRPEVIKHINQRYKLIAEEYGAMYIDLYPYFVEKGTDKLAAKYTNDGLHLMAEGYFQWRDILHPYL